jgi:hypothetical protein
MWRDEQTQTNKKQNKHTNKQTKNSRFRNSRVSVLVWILVLFLHIQSWCWYLSRSSVVVLPGGWLCFFFFSFGLSEAAAWSAPPSVGCGSLSLYVVPRFGISSVAHQFCCGVGFSLCLITVVCFFALPPVSGAKSVICQLAPCCQCVVMVCWLFFNFAVSFDFGCCSLAQEMNFVDLYLPNSGSGLSPTCCQPSCIFSLCLLKVHA